MTSRFMRRGGSAVLLLAAVLPVAACSGGRGTPTVVPDAAVAWEYPVDIGIDTPAVLALGDVVLVRTEDELAAVSASSGARLWAVSGVVGEVYATTSEAVVRTDAARKVEAVDLANGARRVLLEADEKGAFRSIAVTGDRLFTARPLGGEDVEGHRVTAYDLATADERWRRDFDVGFGTALTLHTPFMMGHDDGRTPPTVDDVRAVVPSTDVLYVNNDDDAEDVTTTVRLDPADGDVVETLAEPLKWLASLPPLLGADGNVITRRYRPEDEGCTFTVGIDDGGGGSVVFGAKDSDGDCEAFGFAPRVHGTRVCGSDEQGHAQMVDVLSGTVLWRSEEAGDFVACSADVVLYVRERAALLEDDLVVAYDVNSGAQLWAVADALGGVVHDGVIVQAGSDTRGRDLRTGELRWKLGHDSSIPFDVPGAGDGLVFLSDADGVIAVEAG